MLKTGQVQSLPAAPLTFGVSLGDRQARQVGALLLGAFILKAALFSACSRPSAGRYRPVQHRVRNLYDLIGDNIARGIGYRVEPEATTTMIREPGYPLFLAGVSKSPNTASRRCVSQICCWRPASR